LNIPVEYKSSEKLFWVSVIEETHQYCKEVPVFDFHYFVNHHFNINNFNALSHENLLQLWFQKTDTYSRWLLKQWILQEGSLRESYLFSVFSAITTYSDDELIDTLWLHIFNEMPANTTLFDERKSYLKRLHKDYKIPFHHIEERLEKKLQAISAEPITIQAPYLTNISFVERKYLITALQKSSKHERSTYLELIRTIYPELFYYLTWEMTLHNSTVEDWIPEYFQEYTFSKVFNRKSEKLASILNDKSSDEKSFYDWYYAYHTVEYAQNTSPYIVWIDGLGAEWLPLITYLINRYGKDRNKYVQHTYLKTANLPSTTECNRFENTVRIANFDDYIHNEHPYTYPDDLIRQIELL